MFTKAKKRTTARKPWEEERIAEYLACCDDLAEAIVQRAGDYLLFRGRTMAATAGKGSLSHAAESMLTAAGPSLAVALRDAFERIDWLQHWQFLRRQDAPPSELAPLESIVLGFLQPLTHLHGLVVHPRGIGHHPLHEITWPGARLEKRTVERFYPGLPSWQAVEDAWVQDPIHQRFIHASRAAERLETINLREAR